eukprot:6514546-Alexandrium_andersonii.AAC.1
MVSLLARGGALECYACFGGGGRSEVDLRQLEWPRSGLQNGSSERSIAPFRKVQVGEAPPPRADAVNYVGRPNQEG